MRWDVLAPVDYTSQKMPPAMSGSIAIAIARMASAAPIVIMMAKW
jgi:hypothetical protein